MQLQGEPCSPATQEASPILRGRIAVIETTRTSVGEGPRDSGRLSV